MPDLGEIRAFTEPSPGAKRPLRIVASSGPFGMYLVDEAGNTVAALPVIDQAAIDAAVSKEQARVEIGQTLEKILKEIKDLRTLIEEGLS